MTLTDKARLVLRVLTIMARDPGGIRTGAEIAASVHAPRKPLDRVLSDLKHAGVVTSRPGKLGGYRLEPFVLDLTVGDLWSVIDTDWTLAPCANVRGPRCRGCPADRPCSLRPVLMAAEWAAIRALHDIPLRRLVQPRYAKAA